MSRAVLRFFQPDPFEGLVELHEGAFREFHGQRTEGRVPIPCPPGRRADRPQPISHTENEYECNSQQREADYGDPDEHDRGGCRHLSIIRPLSDQGNVVTAEQLLRVFTEEGALRT
jgi:hypothetical protein